MPPIGDGRDTAGSTPAQTVYRSNLPMGIPMPHAPRSPRPSIRPPSCPVQQSTHARTHTLTRSHARMHARTDACTDARTDTRTDTSTHVRAHTRTHAPLVRVQRCALGQRLEIQRWPTHTCLCASLYARLCACLLVHIHLCTHIFETGYSDGRCQD